MANPNKPARISQEIEKAIDTVDESLRVLVTPGVPVAADVLVGALAHEATTAATDIIVIPAGRTWQGEVTLSCDVAVVAGSAAVGRALGEVLTAGVGVTPAAGAVLRCEARAGANAATGTVGSSGANSSRISLTVKAPAGNAVQLQLVSTISGTNGRVDASASGKLL